MDKHQQKQDSLFGQCADTICINSGLYNSRYIYVFNVSGDNKLMWQWKRKMWKFETIKKIYGKYEINIEERESLFGQCTYIDDIIVGLWGILYHLDVCG